MWCASGDGRRGLHHARAVHAVLRDRRIQFVVITFVAHWAQGFGWSRGGWEYPLFWALIILAIALRGGGLRILLDRQARLGAVGGPDVSRRQRPAHPDPVVVEGGAAHRARSRRRRSAC